MTEVDVKRRFSGVQRLYGESGLAKLQGAHIVVVGIGGVGSWAAEALARNAIGTITLIDLDNIAESNVNRQIHALDDNFGKAKISAMRERILQINPACVVNEIEDFVTPDNASQMLDFHFNVLVDCIDDAKAKAALTAICQDTKIPIIMSGSAGGRLDPTKIKVADLSQVTNDKLLAKVRNILRRDYHFAKASNSQKPANLNVICVYSDESVRAPIANDNTLCAVENTYGITSDALEANIHAGTGDAKNVAVKTNAITGLNCAGYGSSVCVTAPMGFAAAQLAINLLVA